MKRIKALISLSLVVLLMTLCCCSPKSDSLTAQYTRSDSVPVYNFYSGEEITPENYNLYTDAYMDFAASLMANTDSDSNTVVSPLSLYTALAMTANGASGKTLAELEEVLGQGIKVSELNTYTHYLNSRVSALNNEEGKVTSANSLWINEGYSVKAQFLQTLVNYYDAEAFRTRLSGKSGADKINDWVKDKTENEIESLVRDLDENTKVVLANALLFDDGWVTPYTEGSISEGTFTGTKGSHQATFMKSNEMMIESSDAKGIVKSLANTPCKFVAILPNEDVSIDEYVASLSGSKLTALLGSLNGVNRCIASIPQFEVSSSLTLNDSLKAMGLELMFKDEADFGSLTMSDGLFVSDVLQNSFIEIGPQGAKAGAATAVVMKDSADISEFEELNFNRPFVFMIVDNEADLPLFIGTVKDLA